MKFIFETFFLLFIFILLSGCAQSPMLECNRQGGSWIQERCHTKEMLKVDLEGMKRSLIKQAETGETGAMNKLGQIYFNGMYGTEQNYDKAFEYYSKSCTIDTSGCKQSAFMLENGYVSKTNLAKASELLIKSCSDEVAESCITLGNLYRDGQRVKFDLTKAADFYGKACDLGDTRGCEMYKNIKSPQPVQQANSNNSNSNYQQEQQRTRDAWDSIGQSLNSIGNSFNQSANQINQQNQNRRTNYQLQQINNGINNLNGNSKLQPIMPNF